MRRNITSYHPHWIPIIVSQPSDFFMDHELLGWLSERSQIFEINSNPYDFIVVNPSHVGMFFHAMAARMNCYLSDKKKISSSPDDTLS